jgi:hypothetical protein
MLEKLIDEYSNRKVSNKYNSLAVNIVREINIDADGLIFFSLEDINTGGRIPITYEEFILTYELKI